MPHEHSLLVVEDDAQIREALAELLADRGFKAWRARDGREALQRLRKRRRPCLILLDLMMPGINGWEFLALHRENATLSSIPLVLVTAFVDTEIAQARAMIPKPIDFPRMLETLQAILAEEEEPEAARSPRRNGHGRPRRKTSDAGGLSNAR